MFSLKAFERELKRDEGYRSEPYLDSVGYGTASIGYGRTFYSDGERVSLSDKPTNPSEALEWLRADAYAAILYCQTLYPYYDSLPPDIQNVLANMSFNLGGKLRRFRRMNSAVKAGNRKKMAKEMKDSNWYSQVGVRADRLIDKVLNG